MFAYCNNNPVIYFDPYGTALMASFKDDTGLEPMLQTGTGGSVGSIVGLAVGAAVCAVIISEANKKKPINLPSSKKIKIDMDHISSGHMPGGDRNKDGKKSVFWGLSASEVLKAIYEAYNNSSKTCTQGDRIRLLGNSDTFNMLIEIWINISNNVIETAYPKTK